jgi:hypothetical protein
MANIFSEAIVTIMASRAHGVNCGFLGERTEWPAISSLEVDPMLRLPYRCPDGALGSVILMPLTTHSQLEPLDTRAWAMQERLLAPRVLEFATSQTRWNCRVSMEQGKYVDGWTDRDACDGREHGFRPVFGFPRRPTWLKQQWKLSTLSTSRYEVDDLYLGKWQNLVSLYTQRETGVECASRQTSWHIRNCWKVL